MPAYFNLQGSVRKAPHSPSRASFQTKPNSGRVGAGGQWGFAETPPASESNSVMTEYARVTFSTAALMTSSPEPWVQVGERGQPALTNNSPLPRRTVGLLAAARVITKRQNGSGRMDLGECLKVHDLALRADYEIASKEQDFFFELDAMDHLQSFIADCDRRTEVAKKRLAETQEEISAEVAAKAERVHELNEEIGKLLAKVEQLGAEGNVEESQKVMDEVEKARAKKREAEEVYRNSMPASSFQQQKLRVCEVCSAYLGLHDNDRRLADHFGGKLHLGFIEIREKLEELKRVVAEKQEKRNQERLKRREEREREEREKLRRSRSHSKNPKRSRSRERRRHRSRSASRERKRRTRSKSREKRHRHRSRSSSRSRSRSHQRSRHSSRDRSRERSKRRSSKERSGDKDRSLRDQDITSRDKDRSSRERSPRDRERKDKKRSYESTNGRSEDRRSSEEREAGEI
ncbi:putative RNA-binding protein Luc7-like 2 isoform X2 [Ornithorhynchus anatinus]|uniref:Luc7-like protein n=1 Tax=Ornithorhynchus anatinus TaxID=9258 RepID=A0A6I8NRC8_ORNAN|nr:putative RNA-binding protein Luc7-like 2 isoform X2 [Ornithorhynchus anatinus]